MSKRSANEFMHGIIDKKKKLEHHMAAAAGGVSHMTRPGSAGAGNPYLRAPVLPELALQTFIAECRSAARRRLSEPPQLPVTTPFCELEVRLGLLAVPQAAPPRRVAAGGARHVNGRLVAAFDCGTTKVAAAAAVPRPHMVPGVSRRHWQQWTAAALAELGPLAQALGVTDVAHLKRDLVETESVETVYAGYAQNQRVIFPGEHPPVPHHHHNDGPAAATSVGRMESKEKLHVLDLTVPAAPYDLRATLSSEAVLDPAVQGAPPPQWALRRVKRRRSYARRDRAIAWRIDVTEVTTTHRNAGARPAEVEHEVELELSESVMLQLVNEDDPEKLQKLTQQLAQQLWWILSQINPLAEPLNVEEMLRDHPDRQAVDLALAQCAALKAFMQDQQYAVGGGDANVRYDSPIGKSHPPSVSSFAGLRFPGCMPVNFSRHHLDEIQRSAENAYYLSEKTDGVRHFLVFTGTTAVLVDRAMRGKQPILPQSSDIGTNQKDPFAPILDLIQPGTVLDGEVVMNRCKGRKPRPIFIVFDVLSVSTTQPVLHLPFQKRLHHLKQASFRTPQASRDMFDPKLVADASVALPLVRKNFVDRTDLDELLSHVFEDRGMRIYRNGDLHNHLTDGIIFQPNRPYVMGNDTALLKWKYLDTMTIDLELLPMYDMDSEDELRVACMGFDQTTIDMTRHVALPKSERMKLEADRFDSGGKIAEVGFDPEIGEWYYLTMRSDKIAPNHINTVLATLLELSESLTTEELRYRMSVPVGSRDTYRKDLKGMLKQLLSHQRKKLDAAKAGR